MSTPEIIIIVAMAKNRVIGNNNKTPWHIPEDLHHFKTTTMGHGLVMGRKTWESIDHALVGRSNIVISRNVEYKATGCQMAPSLQEGIDLASRQHQKVFIIGGGQIYAEALPLASSIYLSQLQREVSGDVFFPGIDPLQFHLRAENIIHGSEDFSLQIFTRIEKTSVPSRGY